MLEEVDLPYLDVGVDVNVALKGLLLVEYVSARSRSLDLVSSSL
jgi:hypothetical protein